MTVAVQSFFPNLIWLRSLQRPSKDFNASISAWTCVAGSFILKSSQPLLLLLLLLLVLPTTTTTTYYYYSYSYYYYYYYYYSSTYCTPPPPPPKSITTAALFSLPTSRQDCTLSRR